MKTLGIHTAGLGCSVALIDGGRLLSATCADSSRSQAESLMPALFQALRQAGVGLNSIERFGVTVGPGSFTGLRIGLAAIRGMTLATGRPAVGITSFEAAVHALDDDQIDGPLLLAAVESKRAELFVQAFDARRLPMSEPEALLPEQFAARYAGAAMTITGDGASRLEPVFAEQPKVRFRSANQPEAVAVARLAASRDPSGQPPRPLYLRPPDVTIPGKP